MGKDPIIILIREGVPQGDHLSIALYEITLSPLAEEPRAEDPEILAPLYEDDAAFDGTTDQ